MKLDAIIEAKNLNIWKVCRDWGRGKCVCRDCRFLVNMDSHGEQYSVANITRASPLDIEMNEIPIPASEDIHHNEENYKEENNERLAEE
jgi:hypothetical protein